MASERMSDVELARKCSRGDSEAWRIMVARFSPLVFRLSVRMLSTGVEAEDACQEVFLRMYRSFHSFDATRSLKPWVSRIAYNVCLRRLGSVSRQMNSPTEPGQLAQVIERGRPDPEQLAAAKEAETVLLKAMSCLPVQDQALLELRYREGLSEAEVAQAVDMPVNTVKTRLHRARGKLKKRLSGVFRGGELT